MATQTHPPVAPPAEVHRTIPPPPPPPSRSRRMLVTAIWLIVLGAIGYGGYRYFLSSQQKDKAAAQAKEARSAPRSIPVGAAPARVGDVPIYLRGLGTAAAYNTVTVRSRVDGQLLAVHFQEGQFVQKGALLAEIDPRPFQAVLRQAEGQLARDMAQLNDAKVNLQRYEDLFQKGVVAKQQLDAQRASVGQFEGTIEADRANVNSAQLNVTYSKITAPLSGRVGLRLVDVGNMIRSGDPNGLVVITQLQPIAVLFTIPADNLPQVLTKLRSGAKLRVDAYDRDDQNLIATGTLLTVDNQIDPQTGTSRLKAEFSNGNGALFPNQFVNCRLLLETEHNAVLVPAPAVQRGPQGTYVFAVTAEKTAVMRPVTVGFTEGNDVAIDSGVRPGEMVVIDGQDKLQNNSKVDIRTPNGGRVGGGRGGARGARGGGPAAGANGGNATGTSAGGPGSARGMLGAPQGSPATQSGAPSGAAGEGNAARRPGGGRQGRRGSGQ
jgi:multidrug efflux system membrane fusion protein